MKVTRETPDQLIIENNPIWLAVFISAFAMVFIAVGLFLISTEFWMGVGFTVGGIFVGVVFNLAFTRRTQVIFDRPGNLIEMRRKSLLGYSKRSWELQHLSSADVQSSRSSNNTTTYRAVMIINGGMDAGTHPLTLVYSSGSGAQNASNAINRWLHAAG